MPGVGHNLRRYKMTPTGSRSHSGGTSPVSLLGDSDGCVVFEPQPLLLLPAFKIIITRAALVLEGLARMTRVQHGRLSLIGRFVLW